MIHQLMLSIMLCIGMLPHTFLYFYIPIYTKDRFYLVKSLFYLIYYLTNLNVGKAYKNFLLNNVSHKESLIWNSYIDTWKGLYDEFSN